MEKTEANYQAYLNILKEELVPAGGCTEPIAIAYTAATARKTLGAMPERMEVHASGNLIKNAMGVYIPNGGKLRGVNAAAVLGVVGGNPDKKLEVLLDMPEGVLEQATALLNEDFCTLHVLHDDAPLHLIVKLFCGPHTALVELKNSHTHIVRIENDGALLFRAEDEESTDDGMTDHTCLSVAGILDFAETCDLEDIRPILQRQIDCNLKIAEEGLTNDWGVNVGKLYSKHRRRVRRAHERLHPARGHRLRQRKSGRDGLAARGDLRPGARHPARAHAPRAGAVESAVRSYQIRHRPPVGLLRRGLRRHRQRLRPDLPCGRHARADRNDPDQHACHRLRHGLRRREALLCGENRHLSGKRHYGA